MTLLSCDQSVRTRQRSVFRTRPARTTIQSRGPDLVSVFGTGVRLPCVATNPLVRQWAPIRDGSGTLRDRVRRSGRHSILIRSPRTNRPQSMEGCRPDRRRRLGSRVEVTRTPYCRRTALPGDRRPLRARRSVERDGVRREITRATPPRWTRRDVAGGRSKRRGPLGALRTARRVVRANRNRRIQEQTRGLRFTTERPNGILPADVQVHTRRGDDRSRT